MGNHSLQVHRRQLIGLGALGLAGLVTFSGDLFAMQEDKKKEVFTPTFQVSYFGEEWLGENSQHFGNPNYKPSGKDLGKELEFSDAERQQIRKKEPGYMTLHFDPKELVIFDLFSNGKPIARNVKRTNFQRIVIPRIVGKRDYKFVVTCPDFNERQFDFSFDFLDDSAIYREILQRVEKPDGKILPITYEKAVYPRVLEFEFSGVKYHVFGLEGLAKVDKELFASYWQNRDKFLSIGDFRKFYERYEKTTLILNPSSVK